MWRLVGFESLHDGSGDGDVNEFSNDAFIVDACWRLVVYLSSTKGMKFCVPLLAVDVVSIEFQLQSRWICSVVSINNRGKKYIDGKMVVFIQIEVFVRDISVWDVDTRW